MQSEFHNIALEVAQAIGEGCPVVALESTVIAHGLPRPQNLETAHRLQEVVREAGAVPATIAIIGGKLTVGLTDDELALLAEKNDIRKISTRDIPVAVAQGWDGATTVASTAWIAHRAGIKVFATGGIGGVHRGSLPDVSADLPELARTPIVVVCSGAKIVGHHTSFAGSPLRIWTLCVLPSSERTIVAGLPATMTPSTVMLETPLQRRCGFSTTMA